jgi:micrococcal nuclease
MEGSMQINRFAILRGFLFVGVIIAFFMLTTCGKDLVEAKILNVLDGNTIIVNLHGEVKKVQLIGIRTPETRKTKRAEKMARNSIYTIVDIINQGQYVKGYVNSLLKQNQTVFLEFDRQKVGSYKHILAYVWLDKDVMLNEKLLTEGMGTPFVVAPNQKYAEQFDKAYSFARTYKKGLWGKFF